MPWGRILLLVCLKADLLLQNSAELQAHISVLKKTVLKFRKHFRNKSATKFYFDTFSPLQLENYLNDTQSRIVSFF